MGLRQQHGFFIVDSPICPERGILESHNWSLDQEERIVDFTLPQMNKGLFEPFPAGIIIIAPGSPHYGRFRPSRVRFNWSSL